MLVLLVDKRKFDQVWETVIKESKSLAIESSGQLNYCSEVSTNSSGNFKSRVSLEIASEEFNHEMFTTE